MLATCLAFLAVALSPGDVTTIPAGTNLVAPGKLNWSLGDPVIEVPVATNAIVVRTKPEGLAGVVEVKLWDGTARLGWMEDRSLSSARSRLVPSPVVAQAAPLGGGLNAVKPYGEQATTRRRPRRGHLPDFSGLDAAMDDMASFYAAGSGAAGGGFSGAAGGLPGSGGGYYTGPRQPPGRFIGGQGSSHRGGTYVNSGTGNRYQKR